jgi:hypothetical protein
MQCVAIDGARLGVHDRTSILLEAWATDATALAMYHRGARSKVAGIGTVSEANGVLRQEHRPHARQG